MTTEMSSQVQQLKSAFDRSLGTPAPLFRSFIQLSYIERVGFGVNYCFEYEGTADKTTYESIKALVLRYSGALRWDGGSEFNNHGACIWFTPRQGVRSLFANESIMFTSLDEIVEDGVKLSEHLKKGLSGISYPRNSGFASDKPGNLKDPFVPGIHRIYVLKQPEAGFRNPTSSTDRLLHFAPTFPEWKSLLLSLLEIDPKSTSSESFSGLDRPIDGFPLISRITSPYDRVSYRASELPELEQEYETALSMVKETDGRAAVTKMLSAINWAKALQSGLLFEPRD